MMALAGILVLAAVVSAIIIWISPWCLFLGDFTEDDIHRVQISFQHLDNMRTDREILSAVGLMLLLPLGWYLLAQYLLIQRSVGAIHVISNDPLAYAVQSFIFSFMLGSFLGFILMYPAARRLGTFREFRFWGLLNTHYTTDVGYRIPGPAFLGVHWWSYLKGTLIILMVLSYFFTCFIPFDCATFTTQDRIVTNSLVEFREHEYAYDDVDRIYYLDRRETPSGTIEPDEPEFAIIFKDGYVARTRYWAMGIDFTTIINTVGYISLKSGVPVQKGIENIDVKFGIGP